MPVRGVRSTAFLGGLAAVVIFGFPATAHAIDRYVSNANGAVGSPPGSGCAAGQAGYAGIQAAIDASSPGGDQIFICPGTYTDGPYTIQDRNLSISGGGDGVDPALNTIIDGGDTRAGFLITTASGTPGTGATLTFTGLRFVDNSRATGDLGGGAIGPGPFVNLILTVSDSTFTGNSTPDGTEERGGAVYGNTVALTGSTFTGNSSDDEGGAVYATDSLQVNGSTFTQNEAESDNGGALAVPGPATITNSTFTGNFISEAGSRDDGGAVWASAVTVSGSDFDSNTTLPAGSSSTYGGAIFSEGEVDVESSTFTDNRSSDGGGAIHGADGDDGPDVTGSTFTGNIANQLLVEDQEGAGGAIFWDDDPSYELEVVDSVFGGPESGDGNQSQFGGAIRSGGAIFVRGTGAEGTESRFEGNLSVGAGGAIRCGGECGGTIANATEFIGNSSVGTEPGDQAADGGAIGTGGVSDPYTSLTVLTSSFDSNTAAGDGGAISWPVGSAFSEDSTFESNEATNGGAISGYLFGGDGLVLADNSATGNGGAIQALDDIDAPAGLPVAAEVGLGYSTFEENEAAGDGGGVLVEGTFEGEANTFESNLAGGSGGGVAARNPVGSVLTSDGVVLFGASTFEGNESGGPGGAVFSDGRIASGFAQTPLVPDEIRPLNGGNERFYGSTFNGNSAGTSFGAALFGEGVLLTNSTVTGNDGPSTVTATTGQLRLVNSTVASNGSPQAAALHTLTSTGRLVAVNSIISEQGPGCGSGSGGEQVNIGGNVVSTTTTGCDALVGGPLPSVQTRLTPTQIGLEPLANNPVDGNPALTETMALTPYSLALDAARPTYCPPYDQRGFPRQASVCDAGAYELDREAGPVLTVERLGSGEGTVTGESFPIDCGETCSLRTESIEGSSVPVTLTATPSAGSYFSGWSGGGCSGTGPCELPMDRATTVKATFTAGPAPSQGIRVTKLREGVATVGKDRQIRIARVACLDGTCRITGTELTFSARRKGFGGTAVVPRTHLEAGESVVISARVPKGAAARLRRTRSGVASLVVKVTSSDQTRVLRGVRIGLKRGAR